MNPSSLSRDGFVAIIVLLLACVLVAGINNSPQTLASLDAYSKQEPCATSCFYEYQGACSDDLVGSVLGCAQNCISWASNDCYCRTDYQSIATSYLYTCVSKGCTRGDSSIDISSATSLYDSYCSNLGYVAAATTTEHLAGPTTAGPTTMPSPSSPESSTTNNSSPTRGSPGDAQPTENQTTANHTNLSKGEIAGIIVGSTTFALLILLALFYFYRRYQPKHHRPALGNPLPIGDRYEQQPSSREEFQIALICALQLEYDAVSLLFDRFWDENGDRYERAAGDPNTYTTGRIGNYNVVLALLPNTGKASAAGAAASVRSSYTGLQLALLVGICGGVPKKGQGDDKEVLLGDVIVSNGIVQYDFGKQYPDRFARKDTLEDSLGPPNKQIRILLKNLQTERGLENLHRRAACHLKQLQENATQKRRRAKYNYPGTGEDKLFEPTYRHKHHGAPRCACKDCHTKSDPVCEEALRSSCAELQCSEMHLVPRQRLNAKRQLEQDGCSGVQEPVIHIGRIASGDAVIKSGEDRDNIAKETGVIAFEMEGAGIWDEMPCIIVKGVCDYADSHKNKKWQDFAAATAAAAMKAVLDCYSPGNRSQKTG
ncbi:hypothetical protein CFD26_107873 [Aspergillus turcosus]|uniref:Nucleoside phosphorylase domain-containing protein n=1 Tax=Aspergillus turcosus TaxID=1245748 RepID=A0A3R7IIV9_9EURO|nr:hypothetical protein CFD26_107873 [Aspergillus turcosus]